MYSTSIDLINLPSMLNTKPHHIL